MIRPINIKLNAAHPELPLVEATTFTGAPSSVFIRGVPKAVGNWSITAVSVAVTYPDNTTTARAAVESAEGVWVATIPGTATSGRTAAGFKIMADGIDENGAAVTGYVLGFADFAVLSFFPVPAPGETFFYLRYFDTMPTAAKKMDVTTIDGILKYYNGTAWLPFADLTNYYTKAETDNAIERVAAYYITANAQGSNFATRADLINATTYYSGGVVRVPTRNDYAVVLADETHDGAEYRYIYAVADGATTGQWEAQYPIETNDYIALSNKPQINGNTLTGEGSQSGEALGLLDLSGGIMQGDLGINGHDLDITNAGRVIVRGLDGHAAIFAHDGIDISSDGGWTWTHFDWPSAAGTFALTSAIPYDLVTAITASAQLADRTNNYVAPQSGSDAIALTFPAATTGKARDFLVFVSPGLSYSGTISFITPSGATIYGDGFGATVAPGEAWLFSITEIAANTFYTRTQKMEVPT